MKAKAAIQIGIAPWPQVIRGRKKKDTFSASLETWLLKALELSGSLFPYRSLVAANMGISRCLILHACCMMATLLLFHIKDKKLWRAVYIQEIYDREEGFDYAGLAVSLI